MTVNLKPSYAYIIMIGFHKDFPQSQHKLILSLYDLINLLYMQTHVKSKNTLNGFQSLFYYIYNIYIVI